MGHEKTYIQREKRNMANAQDNKILTMTICSWGVIFVEKNRDV